MNDHVESKKESGEHSLIHRGLLSTGLPGSHIVVTILFLATAQVGGLRIMENFETQGNLHQPELPHLLWVSITLCIYC